MMLLLCISVCPGQCSDDKERAKSRALSFWGIEFLSDSDVDTSAPRGRTLDGGTARSLGIKVPRGDSSGEGGAAHGPLHPALLSSKFLVFFVTLLMSRNKFSCLFLVQVCALGKFVRCFSPSGFSPCLP